MFRLVLVIVGFLVQIAAAHAAEPPYRVTLVGDGYDGTAWHTGIRIELDPGWKTYWRMPGEAGIPPDFQWTASAPAVIEVQLPVPRRHHDASGDTVGYENEVVFPVRVDAGPAVDVRLELKLFFAVCKDICIPANAAAAIDLGAMARDPLGSARVENWEKAVPQAGTVVTGARIVEHAGKLALDLELSAAFDDVIVEGPAGAYFRAPEFGAGGLAARLLIDNVKDAAKLQGARLTVTVRSGDTGLEQTVTLP
jgi:DsbC/DsbD-like thiol-disulfide interchange protein